MEGAVRIFAGEFLQANLTLPGENERSPSWIVSPSGACFRQVFLAGALTEVHEESDLLRARLADPTGGFDLVCGGRNTPAADTLRNLSRPCFISVLGYAYLFTRGNSVTRTIRPEHVRSIDRSVRDQWVLATGQATLARLERMRDLLSSKNADRPEAAALCHYRISSAQLNVLAEMLESAISSIPQAAVTPEQPDARARVVDFLNSRPGPRGVAVQEIIDSLGEDGLSQDLVLKAIEALVLDDECYQPQKGFIRLL